MTRTLLVLVLVAAACAAWALDMTTLKDAPITRLTGEEVKAFRAVVMKTLDDAPDGKTVEWKAPQTPFTSKITPARKFNDGNFLCRSATIESDAGDRYQRGVYTFCKQANTEWQFRIPTSNTRSK